MAGPLLARLGAVAGHVGKQMFAKPEGALGYASLIGRVAPEVLFPLAVNFQLPADTPLGDRVGSYLENLALGAGASFGGEMFGATVGRFAAGTGLGRRLGKRFAGGSQFRRELQQTGMNMGGILGNLATMGIPTPFTNRAFEAGFQREQDRIAAQQQSEESQLLSQLGGAGVLLSQSAFDPRLMM